MRLLAILALAFATVARDPQAATSKAASPGAASKTDPRESFRAALDQAGLSMASRRWAPAREKILAALAEHGDADYVLEVLPEVLEDLRRCAFWAKTTPPRPKDVVAGDLLEYDAKAGKLKIRYRADKEAKKDQPKRRKGTRKLAFESDFVEHDEIYVHPLVFKGPYSLELKCGPIGRHQPRIAVCMDESSLFLAFATSPAAIFRIEGDERRVAALSTNTINVGDAARVRIDVRDQQIAVSVNDAQVAVCEKPKGGFGQAGFYDFPDVDEVTVSGRVETSWIDGLVDAEVSKLQAAFDKDYDAAKDLPEVLKKHAAKAALGEEAKLFALAPGADSPERAKRIQSAVGFSDKGDWKAGVELARSWKDPADELLRSWYAGLFLLLGGKQGEGLAELRRTAELDPKFFPARSLLLDVDMEGLTRPRAIAEAESLAKEFPKEPGAREQLATAFLVAGRRADAKSMLDQSAKDGVASSGLEKLRRSLAHATQGPEWNRAYEYKTAHYDIRSDLSQELCFEASQILESTFTKLDLHLRKAASASKERFRVYLFSGRSGYHAYAADVMGSAPENTAGVYSPVLKQLLVWNLPERESMLRTIRHEGFHQYFDQVVDHAPRWLNEGLAEYYEMSRLVAGKWKDGTIQAGHVAMLKSGDAIVPLEGFLEMGPGAFYAKAPLHYAEGWALVHYLLDGGAEARKRFDTLLDALAAGESTHTAIERAFPAKDLPAVERAFRAHLAAMEED
jgi:hypothetical protein